MKYQITWKQCQDKKKKANNRIEAIGGYITFSALGALLAWTIAYLL